MLLKITMEFNLPEQQEEFNNALNGGSAFVAIEEFYQYLRSEIKYGENADKAEWFQEMRDKFSEICDGLK